MTFLELRILPFLGILFSFLRTIVLLSSALVTHISTSMRLCVIFAYVSMPLWLQTEVCLILPVLFETIAKKKEREGGWLYQAEISATLSETMLQIEG
jgi:hypothetical protein